MKSIKLQVRKMYHILTIFTRFYGVGSKQRFSFFFNGAANVLLPKKIMIMAFIYDYFIFVFLA